MYQSAALGIGVDLHALGSISFDATHAKSQLNNDRNETGMSYRLQYAKNIDATSSPVDFNIGLSCEMTTAISIQFNGTTPSGQNNILLLDNSGNVSSAQGVGVQILKDGQPINFGEQKEVVKSASTTKITLPYQARLIKLSSALRAGDVNATATFDMVYR